MRRLFLITGPRASGRTHLAHELATTMLPTSVVFDLHEFVDKGSYPMQPDPNRFVCLPEDIPTALRALRNIVVKDVVSDFILIRPNEDEVAMVVRKRWEGLWTIRISTATTRENPYLPSAFLRHLDAEFGQS